MLGAMVVALIARGHRLPGGSGRVRRRRCAGPRSRLPEIRCGGLGLVPASGVNRLRVRQFKLFSLNCMFYRGGVEAISESAARAAQELRVVFSRLRRLLKVFATGEDLTPSQTAVLITLWKDGASSTSALAGAERVRPQSMATIVAALDAHGLIRRAPDPDDGRRQVLTLTEAGRERAENDRKAREEWLARSLQDQFSERERRVIVEALSLLQRLTD
jgi:DNA-binding MarR family transcriptional regulator